MQKWSGTLKSVSVSDPIPVNNKPGKTYQLVTLQGNDGFNISTYLDDNTKTLGNGESIEIQYQPNVKKKDGTTYNKFLGFTKVGANTFFNNTTQTNSVSQYTQSTPVEATNTENKVLYNNKYNNTNRLSDEDKAKGQMKGNSVTNSILLVQAATSLAIARKTLDNNGLNTALNDLVELTKTQGLRAAMEVISLHKSLEDLD